MTNLCQYKQLSCFGCCGHTWECKREVLSQINKNTTVYRYSTLEEFRERAHDKLSSSGACKAIIKKGDRIICGLHPSQHKGVDWRDQNCQKNHLCTTYKEFLKWDKKKQKAFLAFIESKKLNHYTYSIGMDSGALLKKFYKSETATRKLPASSRSKSF